MICEFNYTFRELEIVPGDLYDLLGFEEEVPEPFPEMIDRALEDAPALFNIRGGYRIFEEVEINGGNENIRLAGLDFSASKIISTQLRKSTRAALFACTAGEGITRYSSEISKEDPVFAYVYDLLGSVTVEKAMDKIQQTLAEDVRPAGLSISDRYSPGYCDWPVSDQKKLFSLLPASFCGISLSESSLMFPIKSVSGIIGIGSGLKQKGYQCNWCTDTHCIFRRLRRKA